MNVAKVLDRVSQQYGDRPMMYYKDRATSFSEFYSEVCACAEQLRAAGVQSGNRVLLMASNKPSWLACYFAVLSLGSTLVPLNPALTASEVAYIVDDCKPVLALVDSELVDKLEDANHRPNVIELSSSLRVGAASQAAAMKLRCVDVGSVHPAMIFYTSGTTGRPKGAVLSHAAAWSTQKRFGDTTLSVRSSDSALIVGSFAFIMHSNVAALSHIAASATLVIHERFHPQEALEAIARYQVTVVMWVPTMYVMAMEWAESHPVDLSSLRTCISGGAVLPWKVVERFEEMFGKSILNAWGMTEGTPITTFRSGERGRPESIGRAMPGCEIEVLDSDGKRVDGSEVGELVFRSESNMTEYFGKPEATAETLSDGWVKSGDLGWIDVEGYVYLVGRAKDMIIRGGAKVYPVEVEEVLSSHDAVAGCSVVGRPDIRFGETVVAFVQPRAGRSIDIEDLLKFCRTRLASYKLPQEIVVTTDFPYGPTGKVLKRVLRERLALEATTNQT